MPLDFQFCPVASPSRSLPISHHHPLSSISTYSLSVLSMDPSSRNRMPAPNSQQNPQSRIPSSNTLQSMGEVNGRVEQLALVQQALQDGATPTMITGFAMIVAQMQAQATHPEVLLIITSSIGPLERSATFRDGVWHGYDLTHNLIDHRSHMLYGEPDRPPMDQERSFRISPPTIQPIFNPTQPTPSQTMIQLPPPRLQPLTALCLKCYLQSSHHLCLWHLWVSTLALSLPLPLCFLPPFRGEGCKECKQIPSNAIK